METAEIRLRLIEAAARNPVPHQKGFVEGALEAARTWEAYILGAQTQQRPVLGVPKKP